MAKLNYQVTGQSTRLGLTGRECGTSGRNPKAAWLLRNPAWGMDSLNLGLPDRSWKGCRPGTRRRASDQPAHQVSSLAGGLERGWCRDVPFPQHSCASEHRTEKPGGGKTWYCSQPRLHLGPEGKLSWEEQRALVSPRGSPMHVALSLPL